MTDVPHPITNIEMKAAVKAMPPAPEIFVKLGRLLKSGETEMEDVTGLVAKDTSLVSKVLRLSNTAYYHTGEPLLSLEEAINRIGFKELHRVVGMAALSNVFEVWNVAYRVDGDVVWHNALAIGLAMEQLAAANGEDLGEAYSVGILRPLGKQIIDICTKTYKEPPMYQEEEGLPLLDWEKAKFGTTNADASAYLLEAWDFTEEICVGLRHQYNPDYAHKANRYARMLNIAGGIAEKVGKPMPGESSYWIHSEDVFEEAEVNANQVKSATGYVSEKLKKILKAVEG